MFNLPDHPEIQSIERTGYSTWMLPEVEEDDDDE
jgi:hypothetical protein